MTFSIGLRTITRLQRYCQQTLQRYLESGVVYHPSVVGFHVSHGEDCSPNENAVRALRMAARDNPDWVIFSEDDVDIINDLIGSLERWLDRFARPTVRAYPLGCAYPGLIQLARDRGCWDYPLEQFYGTQVVVFRTVDALDYATFLENIPIDANRRDICFDLWLGNWHRQVEPNQLHLLTPAPCFIDHVGQFSIMGDNKQSWERCGRFEAFAGRDWSFQFKEVALGA